MGYQAQDQAHFPLARGRKRKTRTMSGKLEARVAPKEARRIGNSGSFPGHSTMAVAEVDRSWQSIFPIKMTTIEQELFKTCTSVTVGDGTKTSFWKHIWLDGQAPKDIASLCYILAWRKNQTVAASLTQRNWMRGLRRVSMAEAFHQFVHLWQKKFKYTTHESTGPNQVVLYIRWCLLLSLCLRHTIWGITSRLPLGKDMEAQSGKQVQIFPLAIFAV